VLGKQFWLLDKLIETRLMYRNDDGSWSMYSYRYDDDLTEATRVEVTTTGSFEGGDWTFPDSGACQQCHTFPANAALGSQTATMDRPFFYEESGIWAEQLYTLSNIGVLTNLPTHDTNQVVEMPDYRDESYPLQDRAKSWLHTNCHSCHQPGGGGYGLADYRWETEFGDMLICDAPQWGSSLGLPNPAYVRPGDRYNSIVYQRVLRDDVYKMHPFRDGVDEYGAELIGTWIDSLTGCPTPSQAGTGFP
jgi:hypothetical protein